MSPMAMPNTMPNTKAAREKRLIRVLVAWVTGGASTPSGQEEGSDRRPDRLHGTGRRIPDPAATGPAAPRRNRAVSAQARARDGVPHEKWTGYGCRPSLHLWGWKSSLRQLYPV